MKTTLKFILALILSLSAFQVSASHLMGGNITYECVGNNVYKFKAELYRDCNGITLPSSIQLLVSSASCGGQTFTITLELVPSGPEIVTPLCPTEVDACNSSTGVLGVQKYTYTHISGSLGQGLSSPVVIFPNNCTDWVISYSNCCRNFAISTINGPGNSSFYIETTLDNTMSNCNNSPTFDFDPIFYACIGDTVVYSHGVSDADNDNLVFSLVPCMKSATQTVNYDSTASYSATNPLSVNYLHFNPTNGTLKFVSNIAQTGIICMLVEEYRNGVKIGEVMRDIQITSFNCTNQAPILSGINGSITPIGITGGNSISVCANQTTCFTIDAYDANAAQSIGVNYSNSLPGATFSVNATGNTAQVSICWTPTSNNVGTNHFGLSIHDNACPQIGQGNYAYIVNVIDAGGAAFDQATIPLGDSIQIPMVGIGAGCSVTWTASASLSCTNCLSPIATPTTSTTYYYQINCPTGLCNFISDSVVINVQPVTTIQGTVTRHDSLPLYNSWIHLLDTSKTNIDSVLTNAQGFYSFVISDLSIDYYVKATPSNNHGDQVITYYNGSETIQSADSIPILTTINIANFSTIDTASAIGGKSIGGVVGVGTDNFTPYTDVRLILKDANGNFINDAMTDDNGKFKFYGLSEGSYKIFVDKVGIDNELAPMINLAANQSSRDSLEFLLHSYYLEMLNPNSTIEVLNVQNFAIYPNPIQTTFTIQYDLLASANVNIDILDVNGRIVKNVKKERQNAGNYQFFEEISKNNFADGIYFIRLNFDNQIITKRVVVKGQ